jgi:hypothetical protein
MDKEKFINAYVELLNKTLSEAIQKNIVLQVQKNMVEEDILVLQQTVSKIQEDGRSLSLSKQNEIESLKSQLNDSRKQSAVATIEKDELKKNIQHVDTFKSELVKSRLELESLSSSLEEKNKELNELKQKLLLKEKEIYNLKNPSLKNLKKTPAKKTTSLEINEKEETIKDAGSF